MESFAAPAERAGDEELQKSIEAVWKTKFIKELYNAVTEVVLILNKERQIIFHNSNLLKVLGVEDIEGAFGKRPGEVLDCIHASEMEGGCGTSRFCSSCGALTAILNSQQNKNDLQECRMTRRSDGEALDLLIKTSQIILGGFEFTIFSVVNISDEKRRKVLERIFFHDILNTAGSIRAIAELLQDAEDNEIEMFRTMMYSNSAKLIDEIFAQRDLSAAENNELKVNFQEVNSSEILQGVIDMYSKHDVAENKILVIDDNSENIVFKSDKTMLSRIIGNMTKNALEASSEGERVAIGTITKTDQIVFWVTNPGYIPEDIQLKLFKRSFSTKGGGRGVGTYSMRLLSEKYLNGGVDFTSTPETGTTFRAVFPLG